MIKDIINAICELLATKFDKLPVNIKNLGEGFSRPSFFVTHIQSSSEDINKFVFSNNILIQIVYFAPLDKYQNVDTMDQYETFDIVKKIFSQGFFKVNDRAVKIRQLTGGPRDAEIYLTLNLDIAELRENTAAPVETAREIKINIKGGYE